MKTLGSLLLGLGVAVLFLSGAEAGGGKEVKIKGKITCAKCDYNFVKDAEGAPKEEPKGCVTVIVAKKKGKEVVYYFDRAGHKKYHGDICKTPMDGVVTGTVTKKGDRRIITVTDVEFKK
jgi:hypothetical protein